METQLYQKVSKILNVNGFKIKIKRRDCETEWNKIQQYNVYKSHTIHSKIQIENKRMEYIMHIYICNIPMQTATIRNLEQLGNWVAQLSISL